MRMLFYFFLLQTISVPCFALTSYCQRLEERDQWFYQIISAKHDAGIYTGAMQFNFHTKQYSLHGHQVGSPSFDGILEDFECHDHPYTVYNGQQVYRGADVSFKITANDPRYFSHIPFNGYITLSLDEAYIAGSAPFYPISILYTAHN